METNEMEVGKYYDVVDFVRGKYVREDDKAKWIKVLNTDGRTLSNVTVGMPHAEGVREAVDITDRVLRDTHLEMKRTQHAQKVEIAERIAEGEPQPANEQERNESYLSPLVGMKVVKVEAHIDEDGDVWSRIYVKRGREKYMLEIEGNAPGSVFGLPLPLPIRRVTPTRASG